MSIDRDAALKKAEKLLRQGKLDGAIEEYVRLVEAQPRDWNSINILGDLYVRAGRVDQAVAQFVRVADHLFEEGFLPKAAAVYKKALKVKVEEHTLLRLGEIAARQGLLADARTFFRQLAERRRGRGDEPGAADCLVRLARLEETDGDARLAGARAARGAEAVGETVAVLTAESAGDDPELLLTLAQLQLSTGNDPLARVALTRLLMVAPDRRDKVLRLALELAREGRIESAHGCVDVIADAALLAADWDGAVDALRVFVREVPQIPALIKLVELCVDAGMDGPLLEAQAMLADAFLRDGKGTEARVVAEDLIDREPGVEAHVQRLRRALALVGVADVDRVIGEPDDPPLAAAAEPALGPVEPVEVDLSDMLADLGTAPAPNLPVGSSTGPARDLDAVFEDMRTRVSHEQQTTEATALYHRGLEHVREGRVAEAIVDLQGAARVPMLRFQAAAQLGRLHIARRELDAGVEWLERAAEAPPVTPDAGFAVLYDLADALEGLGEPARALAVLLELDAGAAGYRDVPRRIERLTRVQAGSGDT